MSYKRLWLSLYIEVESFYKNIEPVLTMLVLIHLRTSSYHLAVLTIQLIYSSQNPHIKIDLLLLLLLLLPSRGQNPLSYYTL